MWTACPHCDSRFEVEDSNFGRNIDCINCAKPFRAKIATEHPPKSIDVVEESEKESAEKSGGKAKASNKKAVMSQIAAIRKQLEKMLPTINTIVKNKENESNTRMVLDRIFQDVLGYKLEEIKTEQKIQGKKADYVLCIGDQEVLVVEAKKAGMRLQEKQVSQVAFYGASCGIKWALLTNAQTWQLYYIAMGEKVEPKLVFTLDLKEGLDPKDAQFFFLLSRGGMSRPQILENMWQKINALRYSNLLRAITSKGVIGKIREELVKQSQYKKLTHQDVLSAIQQDVLGMN